MSRVENSYMQKLQIFYLTWAVQKLMLSLT